MITTPTALAVTFDPVLDGGWIALLVLPLLAVCAFFAVCRRHDRGSWLLRGLMVLAVLGVLVRPGVGTAESQARASDIEMLVVVDRTTSMVAEDHDGGQPRIDGVRRDLRALAESLPGARFSLITFGRIVRTELPFTSDVESFTTAIETLRIEGQFDGDGSSVDKPLEDVLATLERAREQHPDRRRVVVFVSDGENTTSEGEQASFAPVADLSDGGLVLGYGTEEGGRMRIDEGRDSFVYDSEAGGEARSRIDEENLEQIAGEMDVDYLHRTGPGGLDAWADSLEAEYTPDGREARAAHELYWVFALLLFALALLELRIGWRGYLVARREVASL